MIRASVICAALLTGSASHAEPSVVFTDFLGPFVGEGAALHPNNESPVRARFFGTDLGFSYTHAGRLHFLFGDTSANVAGEQIERQTGTLYDDMFGWLELAEWPDPGMIDATRMPVLELGQHPGSPELMAIDPGHVFDGLKTPEAGFSDETNQFGVLLLTKPQGCRTDTDCDDGLDCATELGFRGAPWFEERGFTQGCIDGQQGCQDDTLQTLDERWIEGTGLCVDRTASNWDETPAGRASPVALRQRIGLRSKTNPARYRKVSDWMTSKFLNTTTRVVRSLDPATGRVRPMPVAGRGKSGAKPRQVLMWGRPGFIGVGARGRDLGLYFAWAEIPATPDFNWTPHYFAGFDAQGLPRFSDHQTEAVALDLDSESGGRQPGEILDLVQHMSVAWVAPLSKWVMLYGGGIDATPIPALGLGRCGLVELFVADHCEEVRYLQGAVRMRTADQPWGPWSRPEVVIEGGDPAIAGSGQFGPGGALYHPACTEPGCAPHYPVFNPQGHGWFYGANIIVPWITATDSGVELLWNASTWDPYRVVLFRTRIQL